MKTYYLGNLLRGYFEGDFNDMETAWVVLCNRFNQSYPSTGGRNVYLWITQENEYGFTDPTPCKKGVSKVEPVSDDKRDKCKVAEYFYR